jgi:hypothetical protein
MTAREAEAAAAAAALDLGMQLSAQYHDAAGASPGVGLAVALPSAFAPMGPVQGLGFGIPPGEPALRKPDPASPPGPSYAAEVVGGLGHHSATPGGQAGLDGVSWPGSSGRSQSAIAYVGRGSKAVRPSGVKQARARIRRLRGRGAR